MSQMEATTGLIGEALMDLEMNGRVWGARGALHASMAPHGHYPAAGDDAWVAISCAGDCEWEGLRRAMGDPAWARDARLATHAGRLGARDEMDALLAGWTRGLSAEAITARCQAEGVAAAPVLGLEAHATHPHIRARRTLTSLRHPKAGEFSLYASPIKLSVTPGRIERTAPCLGEDNERIFQGLLGLNPREYRALEAQGVVR
jgi:crotonobetainyl-CoA:carnitine CoA-transferase CaiB-like acyl-CoA transferase